VICTEAKIEQPTSVEYQQAMIFENLNSAIMMTKADIAKKCNVSPQNINYVYNKMVRDGKIPDFYKTRKALTRTNKTTPASKPIPRTKTQKTLQVLQPSDYVDLGFADNNIIELIQDMEYNFDVAFMGDDDYSY